ncbi:hypothetical protein CDAR_175151 [Caerostris darwini]|uniref:Uncharacterized protein n=1 Tax=Caerostris darwini TaxID=1538125 RepID=A0AAV4W114_9ARAC|nr:hypothetical protein CDAR_175151 [Caerostris darwini]
MLTAIPSTPRYFLPTTSLLKTKSTPQTTHHNPPTVPPLQMSRNQKPKSLAGELRAHRTMEHNEPYYATNELPVLTFRLFQMATRAPQGGQGVGRGPPIEFSIPCMLMHLCFYIYWKLQGLLTEGVLCLQMCHGQMSFWSGSALSSNFGWW